MPSWWMPVARTSGSTGRSSPHPRSTSSRPRSPAGLARASWQRHGSQRDGERCRQPEAAHLPDKAYETTACREVYEETGWLVNETDLRPLGFLHFRYADPQPDDHPYPHPDFLHLVYTARATDREGSISEW